MLIRLFNLSSTETFSLAMVQKCGEREQKLIIIAHKELIDESKVFIQLLITHCLMHVQNAVWFLSKESSTTN